MKRLKYISRFSRDMTREEISEMVARAAKKNSKLGITGFLMSSGRVFYQVIEGPEGNIDDLFRQIVSDDRHRDVLLLDEETGVSKRFFPDWSMKKFDLDDDSVSRLSTARENLMMILEMRREIDRLTLAMERTVLRELASGLSDGPSR